MVVSAIEKIHDQDLDSTAFMTRLNFDDLPPENHLVPCEFFVISYLKVNHREGVLPWSVQLLIPLSD